MIKKQFYTLTLALLSTTLLFGCSNPEPEPEPLPRVRVKPLAELLIDYQYTAAAQALSMRDSEISAELNAQVVSIPALVGDTVAQGDALIQLDCRDTVAARDQAEATLTAMQAREFLANKQFERAKSLRASRSVSEDELSQKKSVMDAAQAERVAQIAMLEIARHNVERCTVSAPFNGVITDRYVQEGEHVNSGMPLLHLVDHENMEVHAQITADDADSLVKAINPVFSAGHQQEYPVRVKAVAAVVDARTLTQVTRLEFIDKKPKAGTLGRLIWKDTRRALPTFLVSERNGIRGVLYANSSTVKFHALPESISGQPAFIDLPPETQIITDGRLGLSVDDQVEIIE